ncbi:MAG: hypothetical protein IPK53_20295 [bacterium]|nr:hypothetical protein [bacterium]
MAGSPCAGSTFNGTDPDVMISHSTDGANGGDRGGPWMMFWVGRWEWWQWLAVHPESGDVGVGWLDRATTPNGCLYLPMPAYPPTALLSPQLSALDRPE